MVSVLIGGSTYLINSCCRAIKSSPVVGVSVFIDIVVVPNVGVVTVMMKEEYITSQVIIRLFLTR